MYSVWVGWGVEGGGGFSHVVVSCARAQWMIIDSNHEHASVYMRHVHAADTYYLMDIAPKDYVSGEKKRKEEKGSPSAQKLHTDHCTPLLFRAQELCNVNIVVAVLDPNSPNGLCGRKATLNEGTCIRTQELCESRDGRPGSPPLTVSTISVDVKRH